MYVHFLTNKWKIEIIIKMINEESMKQNSSLDHLRKTLSRIVMNCNQSVYLDNGTCSTETSIRFSIDTLSYSGN